METNDIHPYILIELQLCVLFMITQMSVGVHFAQIHITFKVITIQVYTKLVETFKVQDTDGMNAEMMAIHIK